MNPIDDGGPVFPHGQYAVNTENGCRVYEPWPGMTLRDWFAGQASENDIAEHQLDEWGGKLPNVSRECAKYLYADAMLAARKGKQ